MVAPAQHNQDPSPVILLPGERFFVRRIPIAPDAPIPPQIELALETHAPFSLEQMFYGHIVGQSRQHALIYAAYRRNFSAEEQAAWQSATTVLPEFLLNATLSQEAQPAPIIIRETSNGFEAVAWDDTSELPALILHRSATPENSETVRKELLAEITRRAKPASDRVTTLADPITASLGEKSVLRFTCGDLPTGMLAASTTATADVRDQQILAAQQRDRRRTAWWGHAFVTAISLLIICACVELATFGTSFLLKSREAQLAQNSPEIRQIESAQNLAHRLEQLAAQQLRPFEMLAAINTPRPRSVEFLRVSTVGPLQLDIDAQTTNAADPNTYEAALKQLPFIESVTVRDPRSRSGRTTFSLDIRFNPQWTTQGGES